MVETLHQSGTPKVLDNFHQENFSTAVVIAAEYNVSERTIIESQQKKNQS